MTFWIILGAVGLFLTATALITLGLCMAAKLGDLASDDKATPLSPPVYHTSDRGADPRVVALMHAGLKADEAVARAYAERVN